MRELTATERNRLRHDLCPYCGHGGMIAGPRGGLSRNWFCEACKHAFNFGHVTVRFALPEVWFLEDIAWPDDAILDLYRNDDVHPRH